MRGTVSKYSITLKKKQRKRLEKIVRRRSPSHWLVLRAKVVLLSVTLKRIDAVCKALSLDRQVVRRWRKRFLAGAGACGSTMARAFVFPEFPNHVWAYDFVADRTANGRPLKMLTVIDEFSRRCLAIYVARRMTAIDVLQPLADLFLKYGPLGHVPPVEFEQAYYPHPRHGGGTQLTESPTNPGRFRVRIRALVAGHICSKATHRNA